MTNKEIHGGEMTNKEIAERLREIINGGQHPPHNLIEKLANELDPPKPETGTVVWWRFRKDNEWQLGQVQEYNLLYSFGSDVDKEWADIEWKPARILADDEVAVKIPQMSEWPDNAGQVLAMYATVTSARVAPLRQIITRDEAERMEEK